MLYSGARSAAGLILLVACFSKPVQSFTAVERAGLAPALRPAFVDNPFDSAKESLVETGKKLEASFVNFLDRFGLTAGGKESTHSEKRDAIPLAAGKGEGITIKQGNLNASEKAKKAKEAIVKYGLTSDELNSVGKAFKVFDANGDGAISIVELGETMTALGHSHTPDEIRSMLWQVDVDGSDEIEFDEFIQMMAPKIAAARRPA
jgi:hypothetical protein